MSILKLKNISEEAKQRFEKAFIWLNENKDNEFIVGRTEIAEGVFALRQEYNTFDNQRFEGHKKYADIQYIHDGSENIGVANIDNIRGILQEYSEENDIFFCNVSNSENVTLYNDEFEIFLPEDLHRPCCINEEVCEVKKIVIKVKL